MAGADGSIQADEVRARLEKLRELTNAEISRLLMRLDTERGGAELLSDKQALATVSKVRAQIVRLLEERGGAIITQTELAAADAASAVADGVDLGAFSPRTTQDIARLVGAQSDDIVATFGDASRAVGEAMRAAASSGAQIHELIDEVAQVVDTTYLRAMAAVDAAVMASGRAVVLQAGEDMGAELGTITVYRYLGPDDGKARPFCRSHVDKAYTRAALDSEDNGPNQPKPVSQYLGGYNCRHSLVALTLEEAQARGVEVVL